MDELLIEDILSYPFDCDLIMKKQRRIKRKLMEKNSVLHKRIALLGGSTISDIKNILEIFLLNYGILAEFYEGEYNRYYEESAFLNEALLKFNPEFIFIYTSMANIVHMPDITDSDQIVEQKLDMELRRYYDMWENIKKNYQSIIIQNNMELPSVSLLGNSECSSMQGARNFIERFNAKVYQYACTNRNFYVHDIHYLSALIGLDKWHNRSQYHLYKLAADYDVIPRIAYNMANIVKSILGKNKKCLILDLDNTLWGGVIGDAGVEGIRLGRETPQGEAFVEFQEYIRSLKKRGVILAACSKNDEVNAKAGFTHPDSVLAIDDFAVFKANWKPKPINIAEIAAELNIGLDSVVFVDDNPAERQIVRENFPEVAVLEIDANDVASYITLLDRSGFFEPAMLSEDDFIRARAYEENAKRKQAEYRFQDYGDFLRSLIMKAEISSFVPVYLERITQLINKTNQFNLTNRRYTLAEIESISNNSRYITLYGRLSDKFGDNGLVTAMIAERRQEELHIELWVMSCRVFKRNMEYAMFDSLMELAKTYKVKKIVGYYRESGKNKIVADLYQVLGFQMSQCDHGNFIWYYDCSKHYRRIDEFIERS